VTVGGKNLHDCKRSSAEERWRQGQARCGFIAAAQQWGDYWSAGRRRQGRSDRCSGRSGSRNSRAAATGKKDIEFPAETKLAFTTRAAVTIN